MSKALPSEVQRFGQVSPYALPPDLRRPSNEADSPSTSSFHQSNPANVSFRSWPSAPGGTDDDYGRFITDVINPVSSRSTNEPFSRPWTRHDVGINTEQAGNSKRGDEDDDSRGAEKDGAEVNALLSTADMTEGVHGDWEDDVLENHKGKERNRNSELSEGSIAWKRKAESTLPQDPFASEHAKNIRDKLNADQTEDGKVESHKKGKQRDTNSDYVRIPGDLTPTMTSEIISSLSSLDILSVEYLKSLASLPESVALSDYLDQGRYADDIYGSVMPEGVRHLLDKTSQGMESSKQEDGRTSALRRLVLVSRHLWSQDDSQAHSNPTPTHQNKLFSSLVSSTAPIKEEIADDKPWAAEYAIAAQHMSKPSFRDTLDRNAKMTGVEPRLP